MAKKTAHRKSYQARYMRPRIDPAITEAADIISRMTAREIADKSWVSPSTFYKIKNGKTSRPQNLTIEGLLHAAGYTRKVVRANEPLPERQLRTVVQPRRRKKPKVEFL